mmetsp:Transcript_165251/g.525140  ORF Transcript_165251/g.525140 Transcript_165251/m.525140 type:complete len:184 (+) Transcript_165251:131-682(+)
MAAAGRYHTTGFTSAGRIAAWGKDDKGQCSKVFTMVAAGSRHTAGLTSQGRIVSWGADAYGQCSGSPPLASGELFVMVAAGGWKTAGFGILLGRWFAIGRHRPYQPAVRPDKFRTVPLLSGPEAFAMVATGARQYAALTNRGRIVAWGDDEHGQSHKVPALVVPEADEVSQLVQQRYATQAVA